MQDQTYVPLKEAAKQHDLDEKVLTQLISAGMIEAKEEAGEIFVVVDKNGSNELTREPQTKEEYIAAKFGELQGQPITLSEAANKYDVPRSTMQMWVYRSDYLKPMPPDSYPANFDEAEVAYLVSIYRERQKTGSRARLLDEKGLPYKLKLPNLAKYRRKKKKANSSD